MSDFDADAVGPRLHDIRERIEIARTRSDRAASHVEVLAVTKGFGPDAVHAALGHGLVDLGENYAQELLTKAEQVDPALPVANWHMIGRLQRNKVRQLAALVAVWESVDRLSLGNEIARRAPGAAVLVQANLSGEQHKGGCPLVEVPRLVEGLVELGLEVRGLMGVGPQGTPEQARQGFATLVALADQLELPVRSIGMSGDLEVAVEEGATQVRVGTALFGARPPRDAGESVVTP